MKLNWFIKNMKLKPHKKLLFLIIFLALILRLYKLDRIPAGFANDEAAISYQSYSILKTQKDTWNKFLPLASFRDFGEHLPPLAVYSIIPSILLFGLNEFSTRLPNALISVAAIFPLYGISVSLFKEKRVGLLAILLYAISPLNLGWSRFVYEGNFGSFFYLLGIYFFLAAKTKPKLYALSLISLGLTFATYHVYLFITPITIIVLYSTRIKEFRKNASLSKLLIFTCFLISIYYFLIVASGSGRERFRQVSIFSKQSILEDLNSDISICRNSTDAITCRFFYNKPIAYAREYLYNYFFHFSPTFLGLNGTFLRGVILPQHGLLYLFEIPFFFFSLAYLAVKFSYKSYIIFSWLLLYPLANSFTGVGEISRITHAMGLFPIISSFGLVKAADFFTKKSRKNVFVILTSAFATILIAAFLNKYLIVFPIANAHHGSFAYVELFKKIRNHDLGFENYFVTRDYTGNTPEFQARIFVPIDPEAFQEQQRNTYVIKAPQNYVDYSKLDNFIFFDNAQEISPKDNDLVVVSQKDAQDKKILFTIDEPNKQHVLFAIKGSDFTK